MRIVDGYRHGGTGKAWLPYSNYITIYNPLSGLFTQYVHLVYKGSLVKMGDAVKSGQPIALSGITGQTNTAHLHLQLPGSLPQPGRLEISTGPVYRRL